MSALKTMRKISTCSFLLMWIPFITMMIGFAGVPEGSYKWSEEPALGRYSLYFVGFFIVVTLICFIGGSIVQGLKNQSILAHGEPAEAEIVQVKDTGITINDNPVVRILLKVTPPTGHALRRKRKERSPDCRPRCSSQGRWFRSSIIRIT